MTFNSINFFAFLVIVLCLYYVLTHRWQNRMLLVAGYVFYGWWDARFLLLLALTTAVDYTVAQQIEDAGNRNSARRWLWVSIITNLSILGFFKYFNFFVDSTAGMLEWLGFRASLPTIRILLPVGISFYTFKEMAYTIDVYRGQLKACRNFVDFALFVSYFPELVAGPIMRATVQMPQIVGKRVVGWKNWEEGVPLIILGLFKKVAVADTLAPIVDWSFQRPSVMKGADLLMALYLFSIQIYCDFSGYSDIARGVSKLFGIDLMVNFDHPLFSTSVSNFWRRWHISLSTWLRDYLYFPLGGSRFGKLKTYRNLIVTLLISGLWHGANWTFVVYGALQGIYMSIERLYRDVKKLLVGERAQHERPARSIWSSCAGTLFKIAVTFNLLAFTRVFFRARSFGDAWQVLYGIVTWRYPAIPWAGYRATFLVGVLLIIEFVQYYYKDHAVVLRWPWFARGAAYAAIGLVIVVMGSLDEDVPFIYFEF